MDQEVLTAIDRLSAWCEERKFAGADPYDALNSRIAPLLTLGCKYGRVFWTQILRRSPVDLRPLLLVPPGQNPKGLGLFLESYSKMGVLQKDEPRWRNGMKYLFESLKRTRSDGWHGSCWGYHFPWQSWVAYVPKGTPTVVNTAFIGHALLDYYEMHGIEEALAVAASSADFILNDLHRKEEKDGFCFSYTPADHNYVHNANMLGASLLIRLKKLAGRDELEAPAMSAMSYSISHQHEDGSWFYAEHSSQNYIDSFHTGFNLEALRHFLRAGCAPAEWHEAFARGRKFYRENFFLPDYTPKYYFDRAYCVDCHAPAEAICFFSGEGGEGLTFAGNIIQWLQKNMYDRKHGCYYYRKKGNRVSKIPYMRWVEAWMLRALCEYCYRSSVK